MGLERASLNYRAALKMSVCSEQPRRAGQGRTRGNRLPWLLVQQK